MPYILIKPRTDTRVEIDGDLSPRFRTKIEAKTWLRNKRKVFDLGDVAIRRVR